MNKLRALVAVSLLLGTALVIVAGYESFRTANIILNHPPV